MLRHERKAIVPAAEPSVDGKAVGMGRVATLLEPSSLQLLLSRLLSNLGNPNSIRVALPYSGTADAIKDVRVTSVAVCAGSGGSILSKATEADLWVTGEMSHHEVLAATERGKTVVCLDHSNSERGYLSMVMRKKLYEALAHRTAEDVAEITVEDIVVSKRDQDPFSALISNYGF